MQVYSYISVAELKHDIIENCVIFPATKILILDAEVLTFFLDENLFFVLRHQIKSLLLQYQFVSFAN